MNLGFKLFKKTKRYVALWAILGLLVILTGVYFMEVTLLGFLFWLLSLYFTAMSLCSLYSYLYKKKILNINEKVTGIDTIRDIKRAEVLLEVGQLCSWQFSIKAGILRFDHSNHSFLIDTNLYYTYEELIRNKDIKKILNKVIDSGARFVDDEVFFPIINKWVIVRGRCVDADTSEKPNQFFGVFIDNTERKMIHKQLQILSITDELTGLKNRRFFFEALKNEMLKFKRCNNPFSLAMIDLDFFKKINDTYGHPAGDFILKNFSNLLQEEVRPYDLVARIGGEEFIILFPDINKNDAENIIKRIREKVLKTETIFEGVQIDYTFSCGLGDAWELGLYTEEEFITIIDSRLYRAKDSGRNLVISRS